MSDEKTAGNNEGVYNKYFNEESSDLEPLLKFLGGTDNKDKFFCDDVNLRILLIEQYDTGDYWNGKSVLFNKEQLSCPAKLSSVISQLEGKSQNKVFKKKTYWNETIEFYRLNNKICIANVWEVGGKTFAIKNGAATINAELDWGDKSIVQVVDVGDFESAMVLLSCCKFDIILLDTMDMFDFLLGRKKISTMFPSLQPINDDKVETRIAEEFRNVVKLNRGPLDKYWVLPIKKDFHNKLREANVRTTDHRWNIGYDVDPTTTPNEFLYRINEFIDLQLRLSIYHRDTLLTFMRYTSEDLRDRLDKMTRDKDGKRKKTFEGESYFEEFQDFMGAEYSNFMKRYGARKLIERDAKKDKDNINKSLFATYVKEKFYNKFQIETELNRLMQSFYHQSATMFNDRYGRQRLRESFESLRNFVTFNKLADSEDSEFQKSMRVLRCIIDSDFDLNKASKWVRIIK